MNSLSNIVRQNREAVQRGYGIPGAIGTGPGPVQVVGEIPADEPKDAPATTAPEEAING